ncbi:LuxR C-terminal-related transcriptional regulator [Actinomycetospora sp. CA-101289]|uniref:LuxR C-terminal-related transcriptional regulator n=1 Tax=Actinomycetospora sp. CA-101289 TaxID=3239893 RepID=UPI003D960703
MRRRCGTRSTGTRRTSPCSTSGCRPHHRGAGSRAGATRGPSGRRRPRAVAVRGNAARGLPAPGSGTGVGYLLKERVSDAEHLADAIRRVSAGGTAVDPELVRTALGAPRAVDALARLTTREHVVLELMAQGLSNPAIARKLLLTSKTVETHVRHLFTKLDLPADPDQERRVLAVLTGLRASGPPDGRPASCERWWSWWGCSPRSNWSCSVLVPRRSRRARCASVLVSDAAR